MERYCHLCGEELKVSLDATDDTKLVCEQCGGEDVYFNKATHMDWMYEWEKKELDKILLKMVRIMGGFQLLEKFFQSRTEAEKVARRNKNGDQELKTNEHDIALWGATNSGKTWLFDAFMIRMLKFNTPNMKEHYLEFGFWRRPESASPIKIEIDKINMGEATRDTAERPYIFRRTCRLMDKDNYSKVNFQTHYINLYDERGVNLVYPESETGMINDKSHDFALGRVSASRFIIITIDNNAEVFQDLRNSLEKLRNKIRGEDKYIAVCLTKADKFPEFFNEQHHPGYEKNSRTFNAILGRIFGENQQKLIEEFKTLENDGHHLAYFCLSACGFHDGKPNITQASSLANKNYVEPVNVELPFLWLFNIIEHARLQPDLSGLYSYLSGGKEPGKAVYNSRVRKYIHYKKMLPSLSLPSLEKEEIL